MEEDQVLQLLKGTEVSLRIKAIAKLYEELEQREKHFTEVFHIHCKEGCGHCCEHFNPDITMLEAEFLAYGLIREGRDTQVLEHLKEVGVFDEFCPLYNWNDNMHHCSVYPWRPLICRLFGAAAVRNKSGELEFRQCHWNVGAPRITTFDLMLRQEDVVAMGDFGMQLEEMQPGDNQTYPLKEILEKAINKIRMLMSFESEPEPNAS